MKDLAGIWQVSKLDAGAMRQWFPGPPAGSAIARRETAVLYMTCTIFATDGTPLVLTMKSM
jgi:hypothetical protein